MNAQAKNTITQDARLWVMALLLSMLFNFALILGVGLMVVKGILLREDAIEKAPAPVTADATIFIEAAQIQPESEEPQVVPAEEKKRFARTSQNQASEAPEKAEYIGERSTQATSDRTPDASAALQPAQKGIDPRDDQEIETTESRYQDGVLSESQPQPSAVEAEQQAPVPLERPEKQQQEPSITKNNDPGLDEQVSLPSPRDKLLDGPNPVDVRVPKGVGAQEQLKKSAERQELADTPPAKKPLETSRPAQAPPKTSFSGNQRKTALMGSISRTGRSALNVDNTALGRYQAVISRAVEQEWQRNCVRHRDFITPGFLTVRFFVETNGKIRSVQFVGDMQTGEIQKGFTLNSIRDAEIPAMPKELRNDYVDEPLELMFRFYF